MPVQATAGAASYDAFGGGVAAGPANYIEDVFSTWLYTGNGSTQTINNGLNISNRVGGAIVLSSASSYLAVNSQNTGFSFDGAFTVEAWCFPTQIDSVLDAIFSLNISDEWNSKGGGLVMSVGNLHYGSVNVNYSTAQIPVGQWSHIAVSRSESGTLKAFVNGVQAASVEYPFTLGNGTGNIPGIGAFDYGLYGINQPPRFRFYGMISNLRVIKGTGLYTGSFTPPTQALTAVAGTRLLIGQSPSPLADNSSFAYSINNVNGLATAENSTGPFTSSASPNGGLVWIKGRGSISDNNLFDTARGTDYRLRTNETSAQQFTPNLLTAFNSNGFSLSATGGSAVNANGATYTSWTFRKQPKFFDVVTYTGTGVPRTIPHNLGSVPGCIIVKMVTLNGYRWRVYHAGANGGVNPQNYALSLNTTDAQVEDTYWNNTAPTATEFTVGDYGQVNNAGSTFVAYLFAHNAGGFGLTGTDNVISCGSTTADASGNFVISLGYEPQFVLVRRTDVADWLIYDVMRDATTAKVIRPNTSAAESAYTGATQFQATGVTIASGGGAGTAAIYIAIRRGPMKVPTTGTSVFDPEAYTGTSATRTITSGFPVDLSISKIRSQGFPGGWFDRLRGALQVIRSSNTDPEVTSPDSLTGFDSNTGVVLGGGGGGRINTSPDTYAMWNFRRAPSFFDVVCYSGNWSGSLRPHNLGVKPELAFVKGRLNSTGDPGYWNWYAATPVATYLSLNSSSGRVSAGQFGFPNSTATGFSPVDCWNIGSAFPDAGSETYVAYLFASCPGVSKVGSYTGNGSSQTINCGFTGGARFVLIKRTDSTGDWYVWDTARGIVTANDPRLSLNTTAAEVTTDDSVDPASTGFIVNQLASTNINVTSATYIFLAIA